MSKWPSTKPTRLYRALLKIGWQPKSAKRGSHIRLVRLGFPDFTWAFHKSDEIGPKVLGWVAKQTGLTPEDL